jgi:hypothetical protein
VQKPRHAPYICAVPLMQNPEHAFQIRLSELKKKSYFNICSLF